MNANPQHGIHRVRSGHARRRVAVISEHASPLGTIGGVDGGGPNVCVAQVAKRLAAAGHCVDGCAPRSSSTASRTLTRTAAATAPVHSGQPGEYRVAWVGDCVMYDVEKLRARGGFDFWCDLPHPHAGEDVLPELRVMEQYGGCGVLPSGVYHQEHPTTVRRLRARNSERRSTRWDASRSRTVPADSSAAGAPRAHRPVEA